MSTKIKILMGVCFLSTQVSWANLKIKQFLSGMDLATVANEKQNLKTSYAVFQQNNYNECTLDPAYTIKKEQAKINLIENQIMDLVKIAQGAGQNSQNSNPKVLNDLSAEWPPLFLCNNIARQNYLFLKYDIYFQQVSLEKLSLLKAGLEKFLPALGEKNESGENTRNLVYKRSDVENNDDVEAPHTQIKPNDLALWSAKKILSKRVLGNGGHVVLIFVKELVDEEVQDQVNYKLSNDSYAEWIVEEDLIFEGPNTEPSHTLAFNGFDDVPSLQGKLRAAYLDSKNKKDGLKQKINELIAKLLKINTKVNVASSFTLSNSLNAKKITFSFNVIPVASLKLPEKIKINLDSEKWTFISTNMQQQIDRFNAQCVENNKVACADVHSLQKQDELDIQNIQINMTHNLTNLRETSALVDKIKNDLSDLFKEAKAPEKSKNPLPIDAFKNMVNNYSQKNYAQKLEAFYFWLSILPTQIKNFPAQPTNQDIVNSAFKSLQQFYNNYLNQNGAQFKKNLKEKLDQVETFLTAARSDIDQTNTVFSSFLDDQELEKKINTKNKLIHHPAICKASVFNQKYLICDDDIESKHSAENPNSKLVDVLLKPDLNLLKLYTLSDKDRDKYLDQLRWAQSVPFTANNPAVVLSSTESISGGKNTKPIQRNACTSNFWRYNLAEKEMPDSKLKEVSDLLPAKQNSVFNIFKKGDALKNPIAYKVLICPLGNIGYQKYITNVLGKKIFVDQLPFAQISAQDKGQMLSIEQQLALVFNLFDALMSAKPKVEPKGANKNKGPDAVQKIHALTQKLGWITTNNQIIFIN